MHHPDTAVGGADPNPQKFNDIMEAYSVLSVRESRLNYDLMRKKNPDHYVASSEEAFNKLHRNDLRDAAGNTPIVSPAADSYAAERKRDLAEQRKQYNVNDMGFYRGGIPQPGRGNLRGSAIGSPGEFHSPQTHNFLENYSYDSNVVTSEDAVKFKAFMNQDRYDFTRSRPIHPMHFDSEYRFMADRSFWGKMVVALVIVMYGWNRFKLEKDRMQQWDRRDGCPTTPAHHFANRGGVLIKKQFMGFEKYHKNTDEMMAWYTKAFPGAFKKAE